MEKTQAEITQDKVTHFISNLSTKELIELVEELEKAAFEETSVLRKAVIECFGEVNILVLQANQLLYPMLKEVTNRLKINELFNSK